MKMGVVGGGGKGIKHADSWWGVRSNKQRGAGMSIANSRARRVQENRRKHFYLGKNILHDSGVPETKEPKGGYAGCCPCW